MSSLQTQLGMADESTYGTIVTPTKFFEFNSENVQAVRGRVESAGMRSGSRALRSDRFVPTDGGAAGPVAFEVLSKGFGIWLKHALGAIATSGPTDSMYTHTATVADLLGKFFTMQINRPFHPSGTNQPFTYSGGKIASFELANAVDGLLMFTPVYDFAAESTATGLASASYPATTQPLSWAGGVVSVGGSNLDVTDFKVTVDNGLKLDRHYLRGNTQKKEPVEAAWRQISWELTCDFVDLTQYNRFVSATAAGALAQIIGTWTGPVLGGVSTYPSLTCTMPACRFDGDTPNVSDPGPLSTKLKGKALFDGTNSPITLAYATADATP